MCSSSEDSAVTPLLSDIRYHQVSILILVFFCWSSSHCLSASVSHPTHLLEDIFDGNHLEPNHFAQTGNMNIILKRLLCQTILHLNRKLTEIFGHWWCTLNLCSSWGSKLTWKSLLSTKWHNPTVGETLNPHEMVPKYTPIHVKVIPEPLYAVDRDINPSSCPLSPHYLDLIMEVSWNLWSLLGAEWYHNVVFEALNPHEMVPTSPPLLAMIREVSWNRWSLSLLGAEWYRRVLWLRL